MYITFPLSSLSLGLILSHSLSLSTLVRSANCAAGTFFCFDPLNFFTSVYLICIYAAEFKHLVRLYPMGLNVYT